MNQDTQKLPQILSLFKQTFGFVRQHWLILLQAGAVSALVLTLFELTNSTVYGTVWLLLVINIYIWLTRHLSSGQDVSLGDAFYRGTGSLIGLVLVLVVLSLLLIPAGIGGFVYTIVANPQFGAILVEKVGAGAIWFALAALSLYLLTRVLFAPLIVALPNMRPFRALSLSFKLTKGQTNALFWRLMAAVLLALVVLGVVAAGLVWASVSFSVLSVVLNVLNVLLILPFLIIVTFQLYNSLK